MKSVREVVFIWIALVMLFAGCSTANIAKRGEYIDAKSIQNGTPRLDILARFGQPIETKTDEKGRKFDLFRVEQGETTTGKVLKGAGTTIAAWITLGLSEIVADPVTKDQPKVIFETYYDTRERVEEVKYIQIPK
jgi:hypothetical protein